MFRLERADVLARLRRSAEQLLRERADVVAVWLFGSLARDRATPGSDADLLIVLKDDTSKAFLQRSEPLTSYFHDVGVGCDVLVYTEAEVAHLVKGAPSIVKTALRDGILLAQS